MTATPKITLRECVAQGCDGLLFYCDTPGCGHEGEMPMDMAIVRWGVNTRLDEIAPPCSACGLRNMQTRPRWPARGPGGLPV